MPGRRPGTIKAVPELWPHDLALQEAGRDRIDFKGALLADALVETGILLHRVQEDLHCLRHGDMREDLRRLRPGIALLGALICDLLGALLHRLTRLVHASERELPVRRIEPLALATPEDLFREPRHLRFQRRDPL